MREFKVGDKVKIPSEADIGWKGWAMEMSWACGKMGVVKAVGEHESPTCLVEFERIRDFIYRPSYLLTEPYNQSEQPMEIDLEKEQIFTEPLEGYEFDHHFRGSLKAIMKDDSGQLHFFDEECGRWSICEKIQETPKPKTRLLTHFEILKMDAVFRFKKTNAIGSAWHNHMDAEDCEYCLKSDFQKAQSLEDVVWKPLTTEEV